MSDHGSVELCLPSGERHTLLHGDLIGRLWSAALRLDDPRVSEAHAMVSHRGREMKLLALRGRFQADGLPTTEVSVHPGMEITLAPGLVLTVAAVTLPPAVLAIAAPGVAARVLPGVTSLYGGPPAQVRSGWQPDADAWIWPTGRGWLRSGEPPIPVGEGDAWPVGATTFRAELQPGAPGAAATRQDAAQAPLTLVLRYDTVHLRREGHPVAVLAGQSARLVSELALMGQPCAWEALAAGLWGDLERGGLRHRWDMQIQRLRQKLRDSQIRVDLVRPTGSGLVELVLAPGDVVVDET